MASTASAASWVVNVLVAGTASSAPAAVTKATSATWASGEPPPLVMARVRAPQSRAQASVSTISSVAPDWDSATASTPDRSIRVWYSVAIDGEASVASIPACACSRYDPYTAALSEVPGR